MAKAKILICEDNGIVAIHARNSLISQGYRVVGVAVSAEDVYQKAIETQPDLVLMDIGLQGKSDGVDAANRIREKLDIPIVYLTAYADEATLHRAKITDPYGYVLKPYNDRDLHVTVEIALNRYAADRRLRARERHLSLLNEITQATLASQDLNSLAQVLADQLGTLIQADHCYITLWDENLNRPVPAAASGELRQTYQQLVVQPGEASLSARVLETGKPVVVADSNQTDLISPRVAALFPSRSMIALPLIAGQNKLGAALMGFRELHEFTPDEITQCQQAADLISLALHKTRLLEETRRRAEELSILTEVSVTMRTAQTRSEIPQIVLDQVMKLLNAEAAALILYEPEQERLRVELALGKWSYWTQLTLPENESITLQVVKSGQPYLNNNTEEASPEQVGHLAREAPHSACVALSTRDQPLGALWLGSPVMITEKDLNLLTAISNMTANAIHRQTLYQDLQEQLTNLRKTKDMLIQTEKLAAIGELVAGVAHELNNPLTTIMLYAELLEQRIQNEDAHNDLTKIISEARRTAGIVRGLLDFSRQRSPEKKPIQINDVIRSSLDFMAYELKTHDIGWTVQTDPQLPITMADPHQLQQVLINLINNAWQAMSAHHKTGELAIRSEMGASIYPGRSPKDDLVIRISLKDSGPGIPSDVLVHIFNPFFTTRSEGTGLGLSICHGIISEHGGNIWAESQVGVGTTFYIEIPIIIPSPLKPAAYQDSPAAQPEISARILIIDDEPNVLEVLSRALRKRGYAMEASENGIDGLGRLSQSHYDLIICDLCMPGMNGEEFYQEVEQTAPDLASKIIFTSGDLVNPQSRQFLKKGQVNFIPKPFNLNDLLTVIQSVLSPQDNLTG